MLYCLGSEQELLLELGVDVFVPGFQELQSDMIIITFAHGEGVVEINGMVRD